MPQHKSAAKRVRQADQRRIRNHQKFAHVRTLMKKLRATEDPGAATALLNEVKGKLDRLVGKNIIHKNKAAHYKSKLDRHVASLG